ncbi:hypothetical protein TCAL_06642 [Tigriopus californicus]|uniref:RNA-binding protein 15B n=1 Tax=Tigriopus californicus TaxID=6832 RepID=A0A553NXK8_TIGCA|nr:RNA-binding protein spenito-like [Tigriopus californicus]TRY70154.1 hypothetical protein TCAL_06642 [Tigriopus californicus]|eukprot:TCALIF_06642-PA protein Name:"Similar to RBM15 Putative RNA-binding protein 15 (Homo sapiens)" AED:0.01 eAED:0.07 QI:0/-1/0/1/-1/1/1/0/670
MPLSPDRDGRAFSGRACYKVLCVSALHPKASDDVIRDTLYREYKKYGDISVRVVQELDERVAYVYFRNFEDARDAKHSKSRIILFDKPAQVEPVYESRRDASPGGPSGGGPPPPHYGGGRHGRSMTPPPPHHHHSGGGYSRYRSRSPLVERDYGRPSYPPRDYRDDYHHGGHHGGGGRDYHMGGGRGGDHYQSRGGRGRGGGRGGDGGYHGGGYGHDGGGGGGRNFNDGGGKRDRDGKRDKFPNYLNHIPPEDDPLATRTLFTGNLELNITEEEMRRIFGRYGKLVDIDIKRPPPGTGNAYAFIRYENLDQAHRAKVELSGQYIGKFQCKIGYGKVNATPKVWVGGLGSWASTSLLEREFDRFGAIQKIDYQKASPQAHIFFETLEAAQAAVQEMRGFPLGGPDKRIRIDYADLDDAIIAGGPERASSGGRSTEGDQYSGRGGRSSYGGGGGSRGSARGDDFDRRYPQERGRRGDVNSAEEGEDFSPSRERGLGSVRNAKTIGQIASDAPSKLWEGGLILKNSLFPTKLHLIDGSPRMADILQGDPDQDSLKITQRLRLDQTKLDDVSKRMSSASSYAVFLATSTSLNVTSSAPDVQSRPLRNLISYLRQKEAAGVISIASKDNPDLSGVLYCFPPCPFSSDLLRAEAPDLSIDLAKDDHLVVLVVCGGT